MSQMLLVSRRAVDAILRARLLDKLLQRLRGEAQTYLPAICRSAAWFVNQR
jgi:hypothetical protein